MILLNLNANVEDLDGSETVTLTLTGFGDETTTFKANGIAIDATYDSVNDKYTITNIAAEDINSMTFVHSELATKSITATAQMFEEGIATGSTVVTGTSFDVTVNAVIPTSGDDNLLYSGNAIDANAGEDTLIFGGNIDIDFDAISNITNIEKIDLTETGVDAITNLGINDVIGMTDGDNLLEILGDTTDSVSLKDGDGGSWVQTGSSGGFDEYSKSGDTSAVTLKVDQDITII